MYLRRIKLFIILLFVLSVLGISNSKTITFPSEDKLIITADYYEVNNNAPLIILYHQAGWSRGEYIEIAPKLNKLGFNCLAVDQRSGGEANKINNATYKLAKSKNLGIYYLDAYIDLKAALLYAKKNLTKDKIILWGSSYSSALVFRLAAEHSDLVRGLLAFSPGEYFEKVVKRKNYITGFASKVKCPVFITSAKKETPYWKGIFESVKSRKESYVPKTNGNHGSRALWSKFKDNSGYWKAVKSFLKKTVNF